MTPTITTRGHALHRLGVTRNRVRVLMGVAWDTAVMLIVPMLLVNGVRFVRQEEIRSGVLLLRSKETVSANEAQLLVAAFIALMVFWQSGMYRRIWRLATWSDLERLALASLGAGALAAAATYAPLRQLWQTIALGALIGGSVALALTTPRVMRTVLARRALAMASQRRRRLERAQLARRTEHATRVAHTDAVALPVSLRPRVFIIGAGAEGKQLAQALLEQGRADSPLPVAFLDDDPSLTGTLLHGLPVLGGVSEIAWHARAMQVVEALIASPTIEGDTLRRYFDTARDAQLSVRIVPSLTEITAHRGHAASERAGDARALRDLRIDDLLRRDTERPHSDRVRAFMAGRTVLVTGAGGSIGSELCRHLVRLGVQRLILLGRGENSIVAIERELVAGGTSVELVPIICDVRDGNALARVLAKWRPDTVIHTASHKFVPYLETHPVEALLANVLGTWRLATACADARIERFLFVSSDKAVAARSVFGASKRVAELLVRSMATRLNLPWGTIRLGNALGSRSSVVPTFQAQIERGGPVTVTDRRMTRYFMSIPEAARLALEAAAVISTPGDVLAPDMGEPIPVVRIAEDMIRLAGYEPGVEIEIVETGSRPGEMLEERRLRDHESLVTTEYPALFAVRATDMDDADRVLHLIPMVAGEAMRGMSDETAREWLRRLVPEFGARDATAATAMASAAGATSRPDASRLPLAASVA